MVIDAPSALPSMEGVTYATFSGVQDGNRDVFIEHLKQRHEDARPVLIVRLPCGSTMVYWDYEDIPLKSELCRCGELSFQHWFIRYEDDEP